MKTNEDELEYTLTLGDVNYLVGTRNTHTDSSGNTHVELYLAVLDKKSGRKGLNKWEPMFHVKDVVINWQHFDEVLEEIADRVYEKYKRRINPDDARTIFSRAYTFYKNASIWRKYDS